MEYFTLPMKSPIKSLLPVWSKSLTYMIAQNMQILWGDRLITSQPQYDYMYIHLYG